MYVKCNIQDLTLLRLLKGIIILYKKVREVCITFFVRSSLTRVEIRSALYRNEAVKQAAPGCIVDSRIQTIVFHWRF